MAVVHPLERAWVSTGGTGAQNYDEFADDREITAIVDLQPHSALGVEMPHRAPASLGSTFTEALPAARARLQAAKDAGAYVPAASVVAPYRIADPATGHVSYGLFAMVDTDQISTSRDEPGLVIRNEDVFAAKVRERVQLVEATGHLLSPVLLLQTEGAATLHAELEAACVGDPVVTDRDGAGREHAVWTVGGERARRLCDLAGAGGLVVADGNHRSLAAQTAGLSRFLAVVTTPGSVDLLPYHRLLSQWPGHLPALPAALSGAGAEVTAVDGAPRTPDTPGTVHVYTQRRTYAVRLPVPAAATGVQRLDHSLVEDVLVRGILGWDPGDERVRYIGGDYPDAWLQDRVDTGEAAAALLLAPVRVDDFVRVNLDREKMPRKSTWFVPKARAGLVLAELGG